ncbi:hypothetical protein HanPI659440_Chr04g0152671 [Helianthus annuus]|nr:hypothetical protein HanPI659440_Chr04g0152671 [Helianthus annuus]
MGVFISPLSSLRWCLFFWMQKVCSLRTTSVGICRRRGGPKVYSLQEEEGLFVFTYTKTTSQHTQHTEHSSLPLSLCLHLPATTTTTTTHPIATTTTPSQPPPPPNTHHHHLTSTSSTEHPLPPPSLETHQHHHHREDGSASLSVVLSFRRREPRRFSFSLSDLVATAKQRGGLQVTWGVWGFRQEKKGGRVVGGSPEKKGSRQPALVIEQREKGGEARGCGWLGLIRVSTR